MIVRTYNQCKKATKESNIVVATDSELIKKVCIQNQIKVLITSKRCLTGTDRVAEVAKKIKKNFTLMSKEMSRFVTRRILKRS